MAIDLSKLNDEQCVGILRVIARRWFEHAGVDAFVSYQTVQTHIQKHDEGLPSWLEGPAKKPAAELAKTSRAALEAIANGEDEDARAWLAKEVDDLKTAQAHMFDPITLSILGATLIGCILAARVKKIGSTEFYEGIPPELAKVIKAAAPAITK
jgi:hypothetical protein